VREAGYHCVANADDATVRFFETVEATKQRGLSRPGKAHDAKNVSLSDVEVDISENLDVLALASSFESLIQTLYVYERISHPNPPTPASRPISGKAVIDCRRAGWYTGNQSLFSSIDQN
jgi:hypothetical protein